MKRYLLMMTLLCFVFLNCTNNKEPNNINTPTKTVLEGKDFVYNKKLTSERYKDNTGFDSRYGVVQTAEFACKIAEMYFCQYIYEEENIDKENPFSINLENGVWLIQTKLKGWIGGVAYIEIQQSDGKILKFISDK